MVKFGMWFIQISNPLFRWFLFYLLLRGSDSNAFLSPKYLKALGELTAKPEKQFWYKKGGCILLSGPMILCFRSRSASASSQFPAAQIHSLVDKVKQAVSHPLEILDSVNRIEKLILLCGCSVKRTLWLWCFTKTQNKDKEKAHEKNGAKSNLIFTDYQLLAVVTFSNGKCGKTKTPEKWSQV